jgi:hypothetical protein
MKNAVARGLVSKFLNNRIVLVYNIAAPEALSNSGLTARMI